MDNKAIIATVMGLCSIYILVNIPFTLAQNVTDTTNDISNKTVHIDLVVTKQVYYVKYLGFEPSEVKIKAGTTVVWTNKDTNIHTVTYYSPDPAPFFSNNNQNTTVLFDSGFLAQGESFQHTFDKPGKYPFYDQENRQLTGAVYVVQ